MELFSIRIQRTFQLVSTLHKYMKTRYFEKTLKQVNGRCKAPVAEKTAGCTGMSE